MLIFQSLSFLVLKKTNFQGTFNYTGKRKSSDGGGGKRGKLKT